MDTTTAQRLEEICNRLKEIEEATKANTEVAQRYGRYGDRIFRLIDWVTEKLSGILPAPSRAALEAAPDS